jgi:hypothetical protein
VPAVNGEELRRQLEAINLEAAQAAVGYVPLHAASVEQGGAVVALAGRSGAGKSTLVAAAVIGGWGYVADEITAVRPDDLSVRPFHRPIGLRRGGAAALGVDYPHSVDGRYDQVYPWEVGEQFTRSPGGTLVGIALVEWGDHHGPVLTDIAPARALAELSQHTVIPDEQLAPAFSGLESIVRRVPIVRMQYRSAAEGLRLLDDAAQCWTS